jgi:leucyl/phenylalanyl-tRNA--protein transferase
MVLPIDDLHVPRSLRKNIRKREFRITLDTAFEQVVTECASTHRPDQEGTWITKDMQAAYCQLHRLGHAHSAEAWQGDVLVGGLYGVAIGAMFSGESMFSSRKDASKVVFVHLMRQLKRWDFRLVDCQVHTNHLARFGAVEIPRVDYLQAMEEALNQPGKSGKWKFDSDFECNG